jgi:transcriptional regulator with XRE-family HTH domain
VGSQIEQVRRRIADRLADALRRRGISAEVLAELSGVPVGAVESLIRAESDLSVGALYRLAGALETRPSELLRGIEWRPDGIGGGRFVLEDEEPG